MTSPDDKTVTARGTTETDGRVTDVQKNDQAGEPTVLIRKPADDDATNQALPIGTRLAEFEIVELIGQGGFGIVYLAYDTQLRRRVALKEYVPASLATRVGTAVVTVKSARHQETFRAGLRSFINEARLLAQFDHQSLVKVHRFWEANGTAYMVMPYYEGTTLRDALRHRREPPDEAWLLALLGPLIEAVEVLHAAQCFHRDIAPDNIMLLAGSGRPVLLDFGAARRVIGDMTHALTVILKPGYAPVEQYAEVPGMKQGPWTDIYALAAVIYFAILRKTPPVSVGRLMSDTYVPLATAAAGRYSERFLRAIDRALSVRPEERPANVQTLVAELGIANGQVNRPLNVVGDSALPAGAPGNTTTASSTVTATAARLPTGLRNTDAQVATERGAAPTVAGTRNGSRKQPVMITAAAVCIVALAAAGAWVVWRHAPEPPSPSTVTAGTASPATPATPANPPVASQPRQGQPTQTEGASTPAAQGTVASPQIPPATATVPASASVAAQPDTTPARPTTPPVREPSEVATEPNDTGAPAEKPTLEGSVSAVFDSSAFVVAGKVVNLYAIRGDDGAPAKSLQRYLRARGGRLSCFARSSTTFQCFAQGEDVAEKAVRSGWARVRENAPEPYVLAEREARHARRGVWASM